MKKISQGKRNHLKNIVDENGRIGALAIDQRGALKKTNWSIQRNKRSRYSWF